MWCKKAVLEPLVPRAAPEFYAESESQAFEGQFAVSATVQAADVYF